MAPQDHPICYLCGKPIVGSPSMDHIPPQQFFAPERRQKFNLDRLITLPTHASCNETFGRDEEYVVAALVALCLESHTAAAVVKHHASKFREGKFQGLGHKILKSFERRPSGLVLPRGLVAVRVEGARIQRVVWKIIRGLYIVETGSLLPEDTKFTVYMREPANRDPLEFAEVWEVVKAQEEKGAYQKVFAYKYLPLEAEDQRLHAWGMLWWNCIMMFVAHDHPGAALVEPD